MDFVKVTPSFKHLFHLFTAFLDHYVRNAPNITRLEVMTINLSIFEIDGYAKDGEEREA